MHANALDLMTPITLRLPAWLKSMLPPTHPARRFSVQSMLFAFGEGIVVATLGMTAATRAERYLRRDIVDAPA